MSSFLSTFQEDLILQEYIPEEYVAGSAINRVDLLIKGICFLERSVPDEEAVASGFCVESKGNLYLITNYHVIANRSMPTLDRDVLRNRVKNHITPLFNYLNDDNGEEAILDPDFYFA